MSVELELPSTSQADPSRRRKLIVNALEWNRWLACSTFSANFCAENERRAQRNVHVAGLDPRATKGETLAAGIVC